MDFVNSPLALMTPMDLSLSPNPLLTESCFIVGLVLMLTVHGVTPFRVLILTTPVPISPYSTEGIPEITSTLSTLEDAMLLVVIPLRPLPVARLLKLALLLMRTPSTSIAVPNEELPASLVPSDRTFTTCWLVRSGLTVRPPGRSAEISATLTI